MLRFTRQEHSETISVMFMSSGITRRKGQSGKTETVQCAQCGAIVPRDKAIEKIRSTLPLSKHLRNMLQRQGAYIHSTRRVVTYCISCAKHRKYV
jgi:small subunit ribosomal protein S26e